MTTMLLQALFALFVVPLLAMLAAAFWLVLIALAMTVCDKAEGDAAPFCDIDPLCHPEFVWMPDGTGRIGGIEVAKR